jgi:hypothetical protein
VRIISQDKKRDVPYDSVTVYVSSVFPKEIHVDFVAYKSTEVLGTYNSEEDALCIMKSIRKAAMDGYYYFYMPKAESASFWRQRDSEGGEV